MMMKKKEKKKESTLRMNLESSIMKNKMAHEYIKKVKTLTLMWMILNPVILIAMSWSRKEVEKKKVLKMSSMMKKKKFTLRMNLESTIMKN